MNPDTSSIEMPEVPSEEHKPDHTVQRERSLTSREQLIMETWIPDTYAYIDVVDTAKAGTSHANPSGFKLVEAMRMLSNGSGEGASISAGTLSSLWETLSHDNYRRAIVMIAGTPVWGISYTRDNQGNLVLNFVGEGGTVSNDHWKVNENGALEHYSALMGGGSTKDEDPQNERLARLLALIAEETYLQEKNPLELADTADHPGLALAKTIHGIQEALSHDDSVDMIPVLQTALSTVAKSIQGPSHEGHLYLGDHEDIRHIEFLQDNHGNLTLYEVRKPHEQSCHLWKINQAGEVQRFSYNSLDGPHKESSLQLEEDNGLPELKKLLMQIADTTFNLQGEKEEGSSGGGL